MWKNEPQFCVLHSSNICRSIQFGFLGSVIWAKGQAHVRTLKQSTIVFDVGLLQLCGVTLSIMPLNIMVSLQFWLEAEVDRWFSCHRRWLCCFWYRFGSSKCKFLLISNKNGITLRGRVSFLWVCRPDGRANFYVTCRPQGCADFNFIFTCRVQTLICCYVRRVA